METIKNIIFDLGGVLINLDHTATIQKFKSFGVPHFDELFTQAQHTSLFDDYEMGKITTECFVKELKNILGNKITTEQIIEAWNAMLLDFPESRMELIETLGKKYDLFLLSNTNQLHITEFEAILNKSFTYKRFLKGFKKVYYSFEIGLRKPHPEIFKRVLIQNNLDPQQTIFIDDSAQHIKGAQAAGIRAYWLDLQTDNIHQLLKRLNLYA